MVFFLFLGRLCQIGFGDLLVRYVEGSVDKDAGAMIRDGIKVMEKMGVCPEKIWKYDDGPSFFKQQPDKNCCSM